MSDKTDDFEIDGNPDELMGMDWVAWRFKIEPATLSNKIGDGSIVLPEPIKLGNGKRPIKRWKRGTINSWIDQLEAA